jgi:hypothetical protein
MALDGAIQRGIGNRSSRGESHAQHQQRIARIEVLLITNQIRKKSRPSSPPWLAGEIRQRVGIGNLVGFGQRLEPLVIGRRVE